MKLFYKLFFAAVAVFSFTICFGQNNEWPVRFANGNFITGNNIEKQTFKKENISNALFGDKYFVLLQFSSLPSTETQQKLKDAGIELNNYLPEHTYLAAVKNTFDFGRAKDFNIISTNAVPSFYKINKKLTAYKPSFNKEEEQAIAVNYFEQADKNTVAAALKNKGAFIITEKFNAGGIILIQYNKAIIDSIAALPFVISLGRQPAKDQLLNYNSRAAHAVSGLNAWAGKNLNGKGVTVGVGDNADVSTHIDFTGRLINRNPNTPTNHGTHTTGTAAGAGIIDPKYRGMASKATIVSQSFSDIIVYASSYITDYDMVVTNNSYHSANNGCSGEQEYDGLSRYGDAQMNSYDKLQHVFAAGNDGNSTCSPYPTSFATVKSGWQCAKNILTVGALNVSNNSIASYSGRGPTLDGRIKPEITTDGYAVHSTNAYNTYGDNYGTSMACPGATGALALMYERYRQTHAGADPKSALIKATACNTAEDLGNAGPDYTYGFGMLNTRRAVEALDSNRYFISSITNGGSNTHNITVPANTRRLKIMLYWNDPAAASNAAITLVNDLDLVAIEPSLTLHRPMSLDATAANVNTVATEAPDHKNNIEQVVIENPAAGVYSANINGFNIPSGTQEYVVTYEILKNGVTVEYPFGGETWVPGETESIRWNAYGSEANNFTIEYSTNNGSNWTTIDDNVSSTSRIYNWVVPSVASNNALIRISRNGTALSDQSNFNFIILDQPIVTAVGVCEGAVQLTWNAITNATSYDIYQLIGDSMQVIGNTASASYIITGLDKNKTYWFGAAAKNNTVSGRRSISASIKPNTGDCSLAAFNNDLKVDTILEPNTARQFFSNVVNATKPVKIVIKNLGTVAVSGPFDVSFKYSNAAAITETVNTTINAGGSSTYTFTGMYALPPGPGYNYNFKAWVTKSSDNNHLNDTAYKNVKYINNNAIVTLPFTENFDGMPAAEFTTAEMAIGGNKYLDFFASSNRGRARSFVNSGFSLSGNNALTLDQAPYSNTSNADSAIFNYNLSLFTTKQMRFDFYYKNHGQADAPGNKIWIRGSENNNWVQAYDLYANQADIGEWKKGIINVNEILSNAIPSQTVSETFQIKIGQEGNNSANSPEPVIDADDGYTFDNLVLNEALNDVGLLDINSPAKPGCGLTANNPVSIKIRNYQNTALSNIQVNYKLNNGAVVTEIIPSIAANQTIDYVFTQTVNLSAYIDYNLDVWIKYASDNYASNDSILNYTFHTSPVISSYPYMQSFENDNGNFYSSGTNNSWEWGTPSKSVINKAANGTKIWTTNLTGDYSDNETSYLVTPCFDLTGLTNPALSFSHIFQLEQGFDYSWVEYTTDGKKWNKLGNINQGTNWYDNSNNNWNVLASRWHVASIDIPVTNTTVRFRFVISSDGGVTEEGIGIDDVRVYEKTTIAAAQSPTASAAVSGNNWVALKSGDSILAEINANGQNLGTVNITPYANINSAVRNSNNEYYADRNYVLTSTNSPTGNVGVRLYFTDAEAVALINATGCASCGKPTDAYELGIDKYHGSAVEENGIIDDNFTNYQFILPANTTIIPHGSGYYAEFSVSDFSEFWFSKDDIAPSSYYACQGSSSITFNASISGAIYQWQVDNGNGFTNIINGANYSGAATSSLQLINIPTSNTGYKYRCVVDGGNDIEYTLRFKNLWTGNTSTNWFTASNWSCGIVPDQYTDVIIPPAKLQYPILTANTVIRSIRVVKGSPVIINTGVTLDVNGR